jgi:hypothetical protein
VRRFTRASKPVREFEFRACLLLGFSFEGARQAGRFAVRFPLRTARGASRGLKALSPARPIRDLRPCASRASGPTWAFKGRDVA